MGKWLDALSSEFQKSPSRAVTEVPEAPFCHFWHRDNGAFPSEEARSAILAVGTEYDLHGIQDQTNAAWERGEIDRATMEELAELAWERDRHLYHQQPDARADGQQARDKKKAFYEELIGENA